MAYLEIRMSSEQPERRKLGLDRRMNGERRSASRVLAEKDCRAYVPRRHTDMPVDMVRSGWWSYR